MGSLGVVGYFAFSSSVPIAFGGAALGIVLGAVIGSRIRKTVDMTKMNNEQFTAFKI